MLTAQNALLVSFLCRHIGRLPRSDKQPFHNLKVFKKLLHQLNKYIQHFLECHGMSVEANALSTTVDHIAAVAINAMVQTTPHDYFTS